MSIIPVPQTAIGVTADPNGTVNDIPVKVSREWYRFFGLIQRAQGGSTDIFGDVNQELNLNDEVTNAAIIELRSQLADVSSQAIVARSMAEALQKRVEELEFRPPLLELGELLKSVGTITSGTYTPTLTNVANLDASTAFVTSYLRVNNRVIVAGSVDIDPTLTATNTELGISLPIASNIGATVDVAGAAFDTSIAGMGAAIVGDATNDRARLFFTSTDVTNTSMFFIFMYRII